jgi:hypothetical protein
MKTVSLPAPVFKRRTRTMGDLLNSIALALPDDNWAVEPENTDTQGMTIVDGRNGLLYRLELTQEGIVDNEEWQRRSDVAAARELARSSRDFEQFLREQDKRRKQGKEAANRRDAVIGEDPAGFNGMEAPDVEF